MKKKIKTLNQTKMNSSEGFDLASLPHEAKIQVLVNASDSEYRLLCLLDPMKPLCNDDQIVNRIFRDKCQNRFSANVMQIRPREMSWKDFYYHFEAFYQVFKVGLESGTGITFSIVEHCYENLIPEKDQFLLDDVNMEEDYLTHPNVANLFAFYGLTNEIKFLESSEFLEITITRPTESGAFYGSTNEIKNLESSEFPENSMIRPTQSGANYAAGKGHLDTLKYLHEKYNLLPDEEGFLEAAQNDHVHVLQWLDDMGVHFGEDDIHTAISYASERSSYNTLRYFVQRGYKLTQSDLAELIMDDTSPNFIDSAEFVNATENKLTPEQIVSLLSHDLNNRTKEILDLFYNNGYRFYWDDYANDMANRHVRANQMNRVRNWFISKGLSVILLLHQ